MSKSRSSFPIFKLLFVVILSSVAIIAFDVSKHGSFKASSTGKFTKDIGIYPHVETVIKHTKVYYNRSYTWSVKNVPVYYKTAAETSGPYFVKSWEYVQIAFNQVKQALNVILNYISEKLPFIAQWVQTYAPGLADKKFWSNLFDNIAHFSQIGLRLCLTLVSEGLFYFMVAIETTITWLQTNVFTGNLSSENLQKYAIQGIDNAFSFATKAIFWVQEKFVSIYG